MEDNEKLVKILARQYFNPTVKFEVIMEALLQPIIGDLVSHYLDEDIHFLGEEIPYKNNEKDDNSCSKIGYMLGSTKQIYLVELKTCSDSISKKQMEGYRNKLSGKKAFDKEILHYLFSILKGQYKKAAKKFNKSEDINSLSEFVHIIMDKYGDIHPKPKEYQIDDVTNFFIRKDKTSSAKYLYLAKELTDNVKLYGIDPGTFGKPMQMLYITPRSDEERMGNVDFGRHIFFCEHIALNEIPLRFEYSNDKTWPIVKQLICNIYKEPKTQ